MERYISTMNFYSCTVSGFEQYAMAAFLEKGYFERHIRRLLNDYRGQRERICRMFRESPLSQISRSIRMMPGLIFCCMCGRNLVTWRSVGGQTAGNSRELSVGILLCGCAEISGILVIHYSDMADEILQKVIGALEEIFCNYSEP